MNEEITEKAAEEEEGTAVAEGGAEAAAIGAESEPNWGEVSEEEMGANPAAGGENSNNLDMIMDLPLQVVVELGRTKMLINDLLQLGQGSVIELNKQIGEPLDVLVNGKLVARGEVVVVKEKFGIRITDILSPIERIKRLG